MPTDEVQPQQLPQRICPFLTAAAIMGNAMKAKPGVIQTPGLGQPVSMPEMEAVPCAGLQCQMWQPVKSPEGKIVGGDCCFPMGVLQLFNLQNHVATLTQLHGPGVIPSKH